MALPALDNWETTRDSLQRALLILNAVRLRYSAQQPNHLHHSVSVYPHALSSGPFWLASAQTVQEVRLDFVTASINGIALRGHTQKSLALAVMQQEKLDIPLDKLADERPLEVDSALAAAYAQTLYSVFTALARFRARLAGSMTPLVVWPHHFDLSFLWFASKMDDESAPHMNFGFSPGDAGIPRPYLYAYAYPAPPEQTTLALLAPARWHTEGWTGVRADYDDWRGADDPEALLEALCLRVYQTLAPRLAT
ncbi:MAG: hypothetical protein HXY40_11070 [Chloroflexi bacterium]|nr:hypothetical protein [Chloroflexota bacterium]